MLTPCAVLVLTPCGVFRVDSVGYGCVGGLWWSGVKCMGGGCVWYMGIEGGCWVWGVGWGGGISGAGRG